MNVKDTISSVFAKLPFKTLAEKIPESTQAKAPVLKKAIPFANQIVCGLAVLVVVVAVACTGKKEGGSGGGSSGGGRAAPASDFSYRLVMDGEKNRPRVLRDLVQSFLFLMVWQSPDTPGMAAKS